MISLIDRPKKIFYILFIFSIFITYLGYLFYLQAIKTGDFAIRAIITSRRVEVLPSQRGEIFDRNFDVPLAINNDSFALLVIPAEIPSELKETVFSKLAQAIGISIDEIRRKIPPSYYRLYQSIEIATGISPEVVFSIAERIDEFPGVSWLSRPKRNYLESGSFSHIIGYVGEITSDELKVLYNHGYQAGDIIGKAGIEYQYDLLLRGADGKQYKTVDARGRKINITPFDVTPPQMGSNVVLTIDRNLQVLAEKALGQRIGSITVLKPATGEILALASWPSFDANQLTARGGNNYFANLLSDQRTPLINRAIQSHYPPASTIKMVMTTAIIEEKVINPEETILCAGEISLGDRIFRCWIRKPGHGRLNLQEALAQSCDVYFWEVGNNRLGIERIVSYYRDFGLGTPTGIDLRGEASGFVPTPQWKERRFNERWSSGDTLNISIGQGYLLVTPLQAANMLAMIVNDGIIYKPHLLHEVRSYQNNEVVSVIEPEILLQSRISNDAFRQTRENLRSVLVSGTARYPVNTRVVEIAGKTGTAEVGLTDRWHSWFIGYAPYNYEHIEDVIIVCAMIEAANEWEWWAPYATNIIFQGYFGNQTFEEAVRRLGLTRQVTPSTERIE